MHRLNKWHGRRQREGRPVNVLSSIPVILLDFINTDKVTLQYHNKNNTRHKSINVLFIIIKLIRKFGGWFLFSITSSPLFLFVLVCGRRNFFAHWIDAFRGNFRRLFVSLERINRYFTLKKTFTPLIRSSKGGLSLWHWKSRWSLLLGRKLFNIFIRTFHKRFTHYVCVG